MAKEIQKSSKEQMQDIQKTISALKEVLDTRRVLGKGRTKNLGKYSRREVANALYEMSGIWEKKNIKDPYQYAYDYAMKTLGVDIDELFHEKELDDYTGKFAKELESLKSKSPKKDDSLKKAIAKRHSPSSKEKKDHHFEQRVIELEKVLSEREKQEKQKIESLISKLKVMNFLLKEYDLTKKQAEKTVKNAGFFELITNRNKKQFQSQIDNYEQRLRKHKTEIKELAESVNHRLIPEAVKKLLKTSLGYDIWDSETYGHRVKEADALGALWSSVKSVKNIDKKDVIQTARNVGAYYKGISKSTFEMGKGLWDSFQSIPELTKLLPKLKETISEVAESSDEFMKLNDNEKKEVLKQLIEEVYDYLNNAKKEYKKLPPEKQSEKIGELVTEFIAAPALILKMLTKAISLVKKLKVEKPKENKKSTVAFEATDINDYKLKQQFLDSQRKSVLLKLKDIEKQKEAFVMNNTSEFMGLKVSGDSTLHYRPKPGSSLEREWNNFLKKESDIQKSLSNLDTEGFKINAQIAEKKIERNKKKDKELNKKKSPEEKRINAIDKELDTLYYDLGMNDIDGLYANALYFDDIKGFNTINNLYRGKKQDNMREKAEELKEKIDILEIEKMQLGEKIEQKTLKKKNSQGKKIKDNIVKLSGRTSKKVKNQEKLDEINIQMKQLEKKKEDLTEGNITASKGTVKDVLKERDKEIKKMEKKIQTLEKEKKKLR